MGSLLSSCFFFSSRRRHTRLVSDWSSDVCSSDLQSKRVFAYLLLDLTDLRRDRSPVLVPDRRINRAHNLVVADADVAQPAGEQLELRSEERRVGEEGRFRWAPYPLKKKSKEIDVV